jgi:tripartite-type tricarboxylate transporter receptor subunit TctC
MDMMQPIVKAYLFISAALVGVMSSSAVLADNYPSKPIKLVVPFAPGGAADITGRLVADSLSKRIGQPVIVENKPGGGATVGAAYVISMPADGYTLLYTTPGPQITNPYLMARLPYDPKALVPVSRIAWVPSVLVVNAALPVKSVKELIEYARKNPGKVNFGSAGIGASSHLSGELFKSMAGIDISHVPYKGTGQVVQDLIGGNIQMTIDSLSVYLPYIKSGQVKALGIAMPQRSPAMPDLVPVSDDLKGFDATPVNYLSVRSGTSESIVQKLNSEIKAVLGDPALQDRMAKLGLFPQWSTPEDMAREIVQESDKWKDVIQKSGAKAE